MWECLGRQLLCQSCDVWSVLIVILISSHSHSHMNITHHVMKGTFAVLEDMGKGLHMSIVHIKVHIC
jgi:hypothetical protein